MLGFIEETREKHCREVAGRRDDGGEEVGEFIRGFKKYLPGCVKR